MNIASRVWETLSGVNVNGNTEVKGNFTYLSWTWAWSVMMTKYPNTNYTFTDRVFNDGTMEITCELTIIDGDETLVRSMWLPVMGNNNKAINNPSSTDINKAKMRTLVKALAMVGLGIYIYAGEDLPQVESEAKKAQVVATNETSNALMKMVMNNNMGGCLEAWNELAPEELDAVWNGLNNQTQSASNEMITEVAA